MIVASVVCFCWVPMISTSVCSWFGYICVHDLGVCVHFFSRVYVYYVFHYYERM